MLLSVEGEEKDIFPTAPETRCLSGKRPANLRLIGTKRWCNSLSYNWKSGLNSVDIHKSEVKALVWPVFAGSPRLQRGARLMSKVMPNCDPDCSWKAKLTADYLGPSLGTTGWLCSSAYIHRTPV